MKEKYNFLPGLVLVLLIVITLVFLYFFLNPLQPGEKAGQGQGVTAWELAAHLQKAGEGNLKRPMQVIGFEDKFLVSDAGNKQVVLYSRKGRVLNRFGQEGPGTLVFPYDLAITEEKLLVSDLDRGEIVMFTLDGQYLGTFPDAGDVVKRPAGLAVSGQRLYVTDLEHHQVLVFDLHGKLLARWGSGRQGNTYNDFTYPNDVMVEQGKIYISDTGNNRVQVFTPDGQYVQTITHPEKGYLVNNRGLALTPRGNIVVASSMTNSILLFSPEGEFKGSFAGGVEPEGNFNLPNGLAVTNYRGEEFLAIVDKGNNRVSVYKLPGEW